MVTQIFCNCVTGKRESMDYALCKAGVDFWLDLRQDTVGVNAD